MDTNGRTDPDTPSAKPEQTCADSCGLFFAEVDHDRPGTLLLECSRCGRRWRRDGGGELEPVPGVRRTLHASSIS